MMWAIIRSRTGITQCYNLCNPGLKHQPHSSLSYLSTANLKLFRSSRISSGARGHRPPKQISPFITSTHRSTTNLLKIDRAYSVFKQTPLPQTSTQPSSASADTLPEVEIALLSEDFDDRVLPASLTPSYEDLSDEQKQILHKVRAGESIFFTGSAGTGKSVLLRAIIKDLGGPSSSVAVTGSTGIAAINIGGQTLHSWAGIGLGNKPTKQLISRATHLPDVKERWMSVTTLIIDEVSMISSRWFDVLEGIARKIRNINKPFGGIQLVVCGDFFQLPPVAENPKDPTMFAFNSWMWDKCIRTRIKLTQVFRQKDPKLIGMLNDMRVGRVSDESAALLQSLSREVQYEDGIMPTEIVPLRWMAEDSNRRHLRRLPGEPVVFDSVDSTHRSKGRPKIDPAKAEAFFKNIVAPKVVQLKVGAQVMSLRNQKNGKIINGSVGQVVGFITPRDAKLSKIIIISRFERIAERIAHTQEKAKTKRKASQPTKKEIQEKATYEETEWPVVRYESGITAMMGPVEFTFETWDGDKQVERRQVPLILAWALTVHKSQGQTLNRVKVDLRKTFERGQAYVALSRCTSLDGLEVRNFSRDAVFAHPRVQMWSRDLISFHVDSSMMGR